MKCSIIIPCYNESENLPALVTRLSEFPFKDRMEYVLVENGSKDNSYQIMKQLVGDKPEFRIVKVDVNHGYGNGLKQGVTAASGDYIGWLHADMQLGMNELGEFITYLEQHHEPKRIMLKGKRCNRSTMDYVFTFGQAVFDSMLFRTHMTDVQATPVLFDATLREVMTKMPDGFEIDLYAYYMAKKEGYRIHRIPVRQLERVGGASSWNTGLKSKLRQSVRIFKSNIALIKSL